MKQHPLSAAFPAIDAADFAALVRDIEANGLRNPITTLDGMVLDGWHRYSACVAAGVEPVLVELDPTTDPRVFVLSLNLSRRHLTASQRAAAVAAVAKWAPPHRPQKGDPGSPFPQTIETLAVVANVSERTVQRARVAEEAGLGEAVRDGKVSAKRAAEVAKLPVEQRSAALEARSEPKPAPEPEFDDDTRQRLDDLAADLEALTRIVEADDRLAEAAKMLKEEKAAHARTQSLYEAQRVELAEMTREAKRWMKKAQALEKKS